MKTWIISYPRSGNSFTRYLVEFITERPTKDDMATKIVSREQDAMIHDGEDYVAYKRHDFSKIQPEDELIFVLRNYKECLIRHNKGKREINKEFFLKQASNEDGTYAGLLKRYDEHKGKKLLIYYEDLITHPIVILGHLKDFFNADNKMYAEFAKSPQKHVENSLKCYPKSQTKGKDLIHHSKELSRWTKIAIDNVFKKYQKELFNKYLIRYEEVRHN
jgi:hypothetical protein